MDNFDLRKFLVENKLTEQSKLISEDEYKTWRGNSYINATGNIDYMDGWDYVYSEIHKQDTVNDLIFDSTVFIIQKDDISLIRKDYFVEQYAKGIGMIYKEASHLSKQNINQLIYLGDNLKKILA